ncbi:keratinocyte-associated protein 2-like [Acropora muricata]|uniref:keratinocyte-associated protein 2-like n=1 Tax=Acropora muricata TaxID=159855 RepID=UPI0010FCB957
MALPSYTSFLFASTLTVLTFSGMQMFKNNLASTEWMTILGGFLGSLLFIFLLTAIGNLETSMFGRSFQTQFFPEVILCLFVAMFASGLVHRVCVTTCFLFSLVAIYYINKISAKTYAPTTKPIPQMTSRSRKNR